VSAIVNCAVSAIVKIGCAVSAIVDCAVSAVVVI